MLIVSILMLGLGILVLIQKLDKSILYLSLVDLGHHSQIEISYIRLAYRYYISLDIAYSDRDDVYYL